MVAPSRWSIGLRRFPVKLPVGRGVEALTRKVYSRELSLDENHLPPYDKNEDKEKKKRRRKLLEVC
jgi:hypothetical protein